MVEQASRGWGDIATKRLKLLEDAEAEIIKLRESLEKSDVIVNSRDQEISALKSRLARQPLMEADEESVSNETDLSKVEAADLLNKLKARRKKSKADLADIETILEILDK